MFKKAKTFCLFCGSQYGNFKSLGSEVYAFSKSLSEKGYRLIFGGGQEGLMGEVYKGALASPKHHLTGVPFFSFLHELKKKDNFNKLYLAKTLGRRKDIFIEKADVFVIFPGAIGTIDEYFHTLVLNGYGLIDKPIIIVNIDDYWRPLINLTFAPVKSNLMKKEMLGNVYVVSKIDEIEACFLNRPKEKTLAFLYQA